MQLCVFRVLHLEHLRQHIWWPTACVSARCRWAGWQHTVTRRCSHSSLWSGDLGPKGTDTCSYLVNSFWFSSLWGSSLNVFSYFIQTCRWSFDLVISVLHLNTTPGSSRRTDRRSEAVLGGFWHRSSSTKQAATAEHQSWVFLKPFPQQHSWSS